MSTGDRLWHFEGAALPAEWTAVVGGDASVSVADSVALLDGGSGAAKDSAAIVLPFDRSLANYQRVTVCQRSNALTFRPQIRMLYVPGGAVAAPQSTLNGYSLWRWYIYNSGASYYGTVAYWDTGGTQYRWLDSTKAWSTSNGAATPLITADDDYHISGFDWDDVLDRIRYFWVHVATGSTFSAEAAGPKLFALSDWVDLSSIRDGDKTSDLYLALGFLETDLELGGMAQQVEWVRHEWADTLIPAWVNQKMHSSGSGYNLKTISCLRPDGIKLPISRAAGVAVDLAPATWEANKVGQWGSVTFDAIAQRYWMSYSASNGALTGIGIASATDAFGTWTKYGSNPVLAEEAGVHYGLKLQNVLVLDYTEPDPAKRWKLLVTCYSLVDSHMRVYLYTASQPDTTSWTREGVVIDWDAGGLDGDMGPQLYASPIYAAGRWHLYYVAMYNASAWQVFVARGAALRAGAFSPDRAIDYLPRGDGVEMAITSGSSTSRVVTVDSTAGVAQDDSVMYDQDATSQNWRLGRVRKIISSTQLELYHRMPGLTTTGVLRTINNGKNYPTHLMPRGDDWLWLGTSFSIMYLHGSFDAGNEGASLYRGAAPPGRTKPVYDRFNSPGFWLARDNATGSTENPRFATAAVHPFTESVLTITRRRVPRRRR